MFYFRGWDDACPHHHSRKTVFSNVEREDDDEVFRTQLKALEDYSIDAKKKHQHDYVNDLNPAVVNMPPSTSGVVIEEVSNNSNDDESDDDGGRAEILENFPQQQSLGTSRRYSRSRSLCNLQTQKM